MKLITLKPMEKWGVKQPYIVLGFPGVGLVGSIATTYLTETKDFELVATLESDKLAPVTAIHNYKPLPPIRIMASKEKNMVVVLSEASLPISITLPLAEAILKIGEKLKAKMIIALSGMAQIKLSPKRKTFYIATTEKVDRLAKELNLGEAIKEGATTGLTALVMSKCYMLKKDMINVLVEANAESGDPRASSTALKLLSRIVGVNIPTSKLDKEAKEYEKSVEETNISSVSSDMSMFG